MQRKLQAIPQFTNDDLIPIYSKLILKISQPAHYNDALSDILWEIIIKSISWMNLEIHDFLM